LPPGSQPSRPESVARTGYSVVSPNAGRQAGIATSGAVAEGRNRLLSAIVRQHHAGRPVTPASRSVYPSTDGEDGNAHTAGCRRAKRTARECQGNLRVAA